MTDALDPLPLHATVREAADEPARVPRHLAVDHDVDEVAGRWLRRARRPRTHEVPRQVNLAVVHVEPL
jgi:hypothetical protein